MSETWTITLPLVAGWINANHREHWRSKAAKTKTWRLAAHIAGQHRGGHFVTQVRVICTIHKTTNALYDPNNLADTGKAIVDGLRDAGTLMDDTYREVIGPDMRAGEKRPEACVVITIKPVT